MPTQIIDNFDLNSPKPIDNRFVVGSQSFYVNKDVIPFKYPGMRVWDLNQGIYGVPYVWTGTTFSNENSAGVSGGGNPGRIPLYTAPSTLSNSLIYQIGSQLNINNGTGFTPGYLLTVNGGVSVLGTVGISGVGTALTNLKASNITDGFMSTARLSNPATASWILTSGPGSDGNAQFTNPSLLTVGKANQLAVPRTILGITFSGAAPVSGNISQIGTITFGNGSQKLTLEYQASSVKTLRVPSLLNTISNIVVAEQPNTFGTVGSPANQTVNGTVIINKDSETLKLVGNSTGTVYSNYYLNTSKIAQIGGGVTTDFEITNLNLGSLLLRANAGTLVAPSLVNRILINSAGVRISDGGSLIKSIVTGTITVGQSANVIRGTGFTVAPVTTATNTGTATADVTLTGTAGTDFTVVCSLDGDVNNYKYSVASEKQTSNKFRICIAFDNGSGGSTPNGFTGVKNVSFICVVI